MSSDGFFVLKINLLSLLLKFVLWNIRKAVGYAQNEETYNDIHAFPS